MRRLLVPLFVATALIALAGWAASAPPATATASTPGATPTAVVACPEQPGVELPPECVPYDPEAAMALNDLYRQRIDLAPDAQADAEGYIDRVTATLEDLRSDGPPFTEDAVRSALEAEGLAGVQTRSGAGDVLFGAQPPAGGCVYGAVEAEKVTVEAGGYIMDGGCLPAQ